VKRSALAFLVAPLCVPLLVTPYAFLVFPYPDKSPWIVIIVASGVLFGYGGTFLFGIPMFWFLQARKLTSIWAAAATGFLIGAITSLGLVAAFTLVFAKRGFRDLGEEINRVLSTPSDLVFLLCSGLLGIMVGITFWAIARPDRHPLKTS
jgi:hypothetical protein